jgi:hypothetical protein
VTVISWRAKYHTSEEEIETAPLPVIVGGVIVETQLKI